MPAPRVVPYGWHPVPRSGWRSQWQPSLAVAVADWAGLDVPGVIRIPAVLLGVFLLPGVPLVVALRIPGRALATALIVSTSLSVNILVTQTSMVLEWWHPARTQTLLAAVGLAASIAAFGQCRATSAPGRSACPVRTGLVHDWLLLAALAVSLALFIVSARGASTC